MLQSNELDIEVEARIKEIALNKAEIRSKVREKNRQEDAKVKIQMILDKRKKRENGELVSDDEFTIEKGRVKKIKIVKNRMKPLAPGV